MATVTLEDVRKVYDGNVAVEGASFSIADGEFVVLVGPSGSGKSTVLRMIAGLESISGGRILIGDRVVNDMPPKERDIAMVFQNYALYPHMTVYENMAFALKLRKLSKTAIDERVRAAADILGLGPFLSRNPRQLSGGQRQRVAVGRAIVRQPRVFLFDEPLSNLDAKLRVQMRREISRLHRELKATMIYVTHDQTEAMTMGDRIVVMSDGRVQQIGEPLELYRRPANAFVAGFIGSPAMNLFPGTLVQGDGAPSFQGADDGLSLRLPMHAATVARAVMGRDILLGVRPEHLSVVPSGSIDAMGVQLDAIEPMGDVVYLHGTAGAREVTARVLPQPLPDPGATIWLAPDREHLHFFDAGSGASLAVAGDDDPTRS
ncbi:MAG TPA: sn-glycerol-3-phosphate ABC transporter ATP-binding protein UgpC [Gemmatimonadaceae bacterium]